MERPLPPDDPSGVWATIKPFTQAIAAFGIAGAVKVFQIFYQIYRDRKIDRNAQPFARNAQGLYETMEGERDYLRGELAIERRRHSAIENSRNDGVDALNRLHAIAHRIRHTAVVNQALLADALVKANAAIPHLHHLDDIPDLSDLAK